MTTKITLTPVPQEELLIMKKEIQEAFMKGLHECFPNVEDPLTVGIVPSEEDYEQSLFGDESIVRQLMQNGKRIGGVVLQIDEETGRGEVVFFYTLSTAHGKGVGTQAWFAVEKAFPHVTVWELYTPYFEKRNIHFYVNKCGFHIVEFNHKGHRGTHEGEDDPIFEKFEFFRFEKVMPKASRDASCKEK